VCGGVGGEGGEGRAWRSAGGACCVGSAWGSLSVSIELCVHHAVVAREAAAVAVGLPPGVDVPLAEMLLASTL